ncbi:hypothetical protein AV530_014966 [Patagioenas fasciata monilis]|uniref:Uncharacterized protein n=1 Tax=Patagioenas fasciata monilis TaxID=372326 RepID=A0A1V4K0G0_PATFA|nr:hypothetical protein AV530_014966 [Patagioenas fasciata monilis]
MQQLLMHLAVDLPQELNKSWAADMYWIHHVICTEVPQGEETMRTNANGDRQIDFASLLAIPINVPSF